MECRRGIYKHFIYASSYLCLTSTHIVIAGDTDSIMINTRQTDLKAVRKIGEEVSLDN